MKSKVKRVAERLKGKMVLFAISLLVTLAVVLCYWIGVPFLNLMELRSLDLRFRHRGPVEPGPYVVMMNIDELALDKIGRWPWPRTKVGEVIEKLSDAGARVVAMDIVFSEPDVNSSLKLVKKLGREVESVAAGNRELKKLLQREYRLADTDSQMAASIRRSKAKVILGYFFHFGRKVVAHLSEKDIEAKWEAIRRSKIPMVRYTSPAALNVKFRTAVLPESNIPALAASTKAAGYFNVFQDDDGTVRWMPLVMKSGEDLYPTLGLQAVRYYMRDAMVSVTVSDFGVQSVRVGDISIPTDDTGRMLINFRGGTETFPHYSIADLMEGKIGKKELEGRIVILGATAVGLYDLRVSPFAPDFPGPEIHANVIDNILKKDFMIRPSWASAYDLLAIIISGAILGLILTRVRAVVGLLAAIVLFSANLYVAYFFFRDEGLWLNMIYPSLEVLAVYTTVTLYRFISEEREKRKIKGAFSYYVNPSVVNEMLKNPEMLTLGGVKKELSVLFSDIRGFTTISESMTPEGLVHFLNDYLTGMTDLVFLHDGLLDKYMGDAIMAVWGAPLEQVNHAELACSTALDMMSDLKKMREGWRAEGLPDMDIGIGVNSGPMVVGNMGSQVRFDYTVMGDSVNLGSRLEGLNKEYGTSIIIAERTLELVKNSFQFRDLDLVMVKGKQLPVKICELVCRKGESDPRLDILVPFNEGLSAFRAQDWDRAETRFKEALETLPTDGPSALYLRRIEDYRASPPPEDWDGVDVKTTK